MLLTNVAEVSDTILDFLNRSENPALFAGAGVGAHAGLPTWFEFMEHLSTVTRIYEPLSADLIRKRAESGNFLGAATVYKSCHEIPQGELLKQMVIPFGFPPHPEKLRPLASLPFTVSSQ
jgi:hypothetical protein